MPFAGGDISVDLTVKIVPLVLPFIRSFRKRFIERGLVSFDALLLLARDLLRDHPVVREAVKGMYDAILVDEFQDTDPVQCDILLALAEERGCCAKAGEDVRLAAGKLFIVADAKQSIYGFRKADIEAFERVRDAILRQGGCEEHLETSFRSNAAIVDAINGMFGRIIVKNGRLQPSYAPIAALASRPRELPSQGVEFLLFDDAEEKLSAEDAREREAAHIGWWIRENVDRLAIKDEKSGDRSLRYRDVAILFHALTQVQPYVEVLKTLNIPFLIEGEKFFYNTPEIVAFINLLSVIENPRDAVAFCAVLRSPTFAFPDDVLYRLQRAGRLGLPEAVPDEGAYRFLGEEFGDRMERAVRLLTDLHGRSRSCAVDELLREVMGRCHLLEIAATTFHGEQAMANLLKVGDLVVRMAVAPEATLKSVVRFLRKAAEEEREESESLLSDETLNAVRIFSMHRSKGLEFPVVILPNLHGKRERREEDAVRCEWKEGLVGLGLPGGGDLVHAWLGARVRVKRLEEEKRLLYVAMTRARERLILCGGDVGRESGSFMGLLQKGLEIDGFDCVKSQAGSVKVKSGEVRCRRVSEKRAVLPDREATESHEFHPVVGDRLVDAWKERERALRKIEETAAFVSPSTLSGEKPPMGAVKGGDRDEALMLGSLCHEFFRQWDFREKTLTDCWKKILERESGDDPRKAERIGEEIRAMAETFCRSAIGEEICGSRILGKEVPFLFAKGGQIVQGVIDLIYECGGRTIVADYKTDRVGKDELKERGERYRIQREIYVEAVRRAIGGDPVFKLIFLRLGEAMTV
ncbi:MAG: hypothetical protein A2Z34_07965 [Planctomycetes bacterium RBG_16_59_8]|nr:MAG: hypothetical protein A2Z34_07965 [Planctomycetes bacterium RBG_16_59_8]